MIAARWMAACGLAALASAGLAQHGTAGFDKDAYPGDALLPALHRTFAFTGYWLNDPPGMASNPWAGKRAAVRAAGFGFLLIFNGRLDAQLRGQDATALGRADGLEAVAAAKREGFPAGAVIFLDQEEGGALLVEQAAYLGAWISAVERAGFGAGVYCSGIPVAAGSERLSTAQDVVRRFREAKLWVWDDRCPPAPGCVVRSGPEMSGGPVALVWQYAVTPRKPEDTARCAASYSADGTCYAPGIAHSSASYIDLDVSSSTDPSHGR